MCSNQSIRETGNPYAQTSTGVEADLLLLIGRSTGFYDILTNHVSLTQSNIDKILIFCTFIKIFAVVSFYRTQAKKSKRKRYWVHPLIAMRSTKGQFARLLDKSH